MAMNKEQTRECFGVSDIDAFKASVERSITFETSGRGMCLMSMLSDVQEMIADEPNLSALEDARQALNRVKYLISEWVSKPDRAVPTFKAGDFVRYHGNRGVVVGSGSTVPTVEVTFCYGNLRIPATELVYETCEDRGYTCCEQNTREEHISTYGHAPVRA